MPQQADYDRPATAGLALTYPQLMNQARAAGYSGPDLARLARAHGLALRFADGFYRAHATPLLNHLVRTASILIRDRQPPDTALTGLLHAAYLVGHFRDSRRQVPRRAHRRLLRDGVGAAVEQLVRDYPRLRWHRPDVLAGYVRELDDGSATDRLRALLAVRLANTLEDALDDAGAYIAGTADTRARDELLPALAQRLEMRFTAATFDRGFGVGDNGAVPAPLRQRHSQGYYLIEPLWRAGLAERIARKVSRALRSLTEKFNARG